MKALLLAAGLGTRLKPITNEIPKCLVPVNGKPLLEYWLENLYSIGIREFLINTHYMYEKVEKYINQSKYKNHVKLIYEKELLLTGGTILKNRNYFKDEDYLVIHADNLCFCDFKKFIETHYSRPKNCIITMMTFKSDSPESCGIVELKDNIVTNFYEKIKNPPSNMANAAVYIFDKNVISILKNLKKEKIDLSTEVLPKLKNKIYTFHNDIYHRDIGNLESYSLSQIEVFIRKESFKSYL